MTNSNWRILLHATDRTHFTLTLSEYTWRRDRRVGLGILLMEQVTRDGVHQALDEAVDLILHLPPPDQLELPTG